MRLLESFTHDPRIAEPLDGGGDGGRRIGGIRKMTFQLASQPLALADVLDLRVTYDAVDELSDTRAIIHARLQGSPASPPRSTPTGGVWNRRVAAPSR